MRTHGLQLAPFQGLRYVPQRVSSLAAVTSPPYDVVIRPDGLHKLEIADPYNIVRLILPQAPDPAVAHRRAAATLRRWESEGVLSRDQRPALYVYEQRGQRALQRGLIGALRLTSPGEGVVLPHEDVIPTVVAERAALMRETAANLEPLLLSYQGGPDGAADVIERTAASRPLLSTTTEDGFAHRLWAVTDAKDLTQIATDLAQRSALIADGHHRWATYLRLRDEHQGRPPWDRGLVLLVDTVRYPLHVRPIHRVLYQLPVRSALAQLSGAFRVRRLDGPAARALSRLTATAGPAFVLAGDGDFHLIDQPRPELRERTIRADRPAAWRRLDATVLHSTLIDHVWRVPDLPTAIGYLHQADAAVTQAERLNGTAVLMRTVAETEVRVLAEQGVTMPRKSTSFGPKPATGLVLRSLTEET